MALSDKKRDDLFRDIVAVSNEIRHQIAKIVSSEPFASLPQGAQQHLLNNLYMERNNILAGLKDSVVVLPEFTVANSDYPTLAEAEQFIDNCIHHKKLLICRSNAQSKVDSVFSCISYANDTLADFRSLQDAEQDKKSEVDENIIALEDRCENVLSNFADASATALADLESLEKDEQKYFSEMMFDVLSGYVNDRTSAADEELIEIIRMRLAGIEKSSSMEAQLTEVRELLIEVNKHIAIGIAGVRLNQEEKFEKYDKWVRSIQNEDVRKVRRDAPHVQSAVRLEITRYKQGQEEGIVELVDILKIKLQELSEIKDLNTITSKKEEIISIMELGFQEKNSSNGRMEKRSGYFKTQKSK